MASLVFPGPYRLSRYGATGRAGFTNTCGRAAYRGPWMMETVAREQMMDHAARKLGVDPLDLRRRNVLRQDELPHATPSGMVYERISPAEDARAGRADDRLRGLPRGAGLGP